MVKVRFIINWAGYGADLKLLNRGCPKGEEMGNGWSLRKLNPEGRSDGI